MLGYLALTSRPSRQNEKFINEFYRVHALYISLKRFWGQDKFCVANDGRADPVSSTLSSPSTYAALYFSFGGVNTLSV
jgi:hypothetical protein